MTLTAQQQADVNAGLAAAAVLLPPGSAAAAALTVASTIWGAISTAINAGSADVTDAQLAGFFAADDQAKLADALAQAHAAAPATMGAMGLRPVIVSVPGPSSGAGAPGGAPPPPPPPPIDPGSDNSGV